MRPYVTESTALGAAFLAGLAVGFYKSREEIVEKVKVQRVFTPQMNEEKQQDLLNGWVEAVKRAM